MPDNRHHQKRSGVISLIAILIMASVTATSLAAAGIILNELRQTESLDQSILATYASETGVEDGLFIVKTQRATNTLANTQTLLGAADTRQTLRNTAAWTRISSVENRFLVAHLEADSSASLDIFNPDDPSGGSGIASIWVDWSVDCQQIVQLETTMLTWDFVGGHINFDPATQRVFKQDWTCNEDGLGVCQSAVMNNIDGETITANRPYRFTFRVLVPVSSSCNARNMTVTAYDIDNPATLPPDQRVLHVVPLPARVLIKATGQYARSQQAMSASVPWRTPISGLLGFVIFSDEQLQK